MRRLPLFVSEADADFKAGLRTDNPAQLPSFAKDDTFLIAAMKVVPTSSPGQNVFAVVPWDSTTMRASVGLIDAPPETGGVKFEIVGTATSAAVQYPTDLSTTGVTAWKAACLAAINAVAGVNKAAASDPVGTPPHFLFFTWLDAADVRVINAVECTLAPLVAPKTFAQRAAPGYQQLIRLAQLPLKETVDFALEEAAQPTLVNQRIGAVGTNAMQRLTLPTGAAGSLELTWQGAKALLLPVPGVTALTIAAALNALVVAGTTAPSFAVNAVPGAGGTFDIELIGALAQAPQPLLSSLLYPSVPPTVALATLSLTHPRFTKILNGARTAKMQFEFVWVDALGNEARIIKDVTLVANMTTGTTVADAEAAGGVITLTETVFVDAGGQVPYATVSPGTHYTPPAAVGAGIAQVVTHNLNTPLVDVEVFLKISTGPDVRRQMQRPGEFDYTTNAATPNQATLTFSEEITNTPGDPNYRLNYDVFINAKDAAVELFGNVGIDFDHVFDTLPAGQTLRARLAEIMAAIATLAGGLKIEPTSINVDALIVAILARIKTDPALKQLFIDLLKETITDRDLLALILTTIESDATLLSTFNHLLETSLENEEVSTKISEALLKNATFLEEFRKLVIAAFQAGGTLPPGFIPYTFAALDFVVPTPHQFDGPSTPTITGTLETTTTSGSTTTVADDVTTTSGSVVSKGVVPTLKNVAAKRREFEPLPSEIVAFTTGATIAGKVTLADLVEGQTRTASAKVRVQNINGRRGQDFPTGTILGRKAGIIFPLRIDGLNAWPAEMERSFFPVQLNADSLYLDSRFALNFVVLTQLLGNAQGRIEFVFETGTYTHEGAETRDINVFTWTETLAVAIPLTEAESGMSVAIAITRQTSVLIGTFTAALSDVLTLAVAAPANGTKVRVASTGTLPATLQPDTDYFTRDQAGSTCKLALTLGGAAIDLTTIGAGTLTIYARDVRTGTITIHGQTVTTFAVPALPFGMRCWLKRFDAENLTAPAGALIARAKSPSGSIARFA